MILVKIYKFTLKIKLCVLMSIWLFHMPYIGTILSILYTQVNCFAVQILKINVKKSADIFR